MPGSWDLSQNERCVLCAIAYVASCYFWKYIQMLKQKTPKNPTRRAKLIWLTPSSIYNFRTIILIIYRQCWVPLSSLRDFHAKCPFPDVVICAPINNIFPLDNLTFLYCKLELNQWMFVVHLGSRKTVIIFQADCYTLRTSGFWDGKSL